MGRVWRWFSDRKLATYLCSYWLWDHNKSKTKQSSFNTDTWYLVSVEHKTYAKTHIFTHITILLLISFIQTKKATKTQWWQNCWVWTIIAINKELIFIFLSLYLSLQDENKRRESKPVLVLTSAKKLDPRTWPKGILTIRLGDRRGGQKAGPMNLLLKD